jgi:type IV pilus assembly protein PilA
MSVPPPLPPGQSRSEQMVDAYAHRGAPPPSAPPPRQGMSGCAIAAIIGAVVLVLGVFVIAMLAAIALPAYNDYMIRSKLAAAEYYARSLQDSIDAHRDGSGACPDNAALGLADDEVFALPGGRGGTAQAAVKVGESEGGRCAIELTFANLNPAIDGRTMVFESGDSGWDCSAGTLQPKYRSPRCRPDNIHDNSVSP